MRFNYRKLTSIFMMKHNYIQVTTNYRWFKFMSVGSSSCPSGQVHVHWLSSCSPIQVHVKDVTVSIDALHMILPLLPRP